MTGSAFDDLVPRLRRSAGRVRRTLRAARAESGPAAGRATAGGPAIVVPGGPRVVNLAANPSFRLTSGTRELDLDGVPRTVEVFEQLMKEGGVYVHGHCVAFADDVPFRPGLRGLRVVGTDASDDTHVAPGGRNGKNALRMGMKRGRTYTASVGLALEAPLTGPLRTSALRVIAGATVGGEHRWDLARSERARNEPGDHRLSVTFTVPDDASAAWVRLMAGMPAGGGSVVWHSFCLTETDHPVEFFDGDGTDLFHTYAWTGTPHASASVREARSLAEVCAAAGVTGEDLRRLVADEVVRAAAAGDLAGAAHFAAALAADRKDSLALVTLSRVSRAAGDVVTADALLEEAVWSGDPGGDAAFERGLLAQRAKGWTAAIGHYRTAVERRPDDVERNYRFAHALARRKLVPEAKQVLRHAVALDGPLPFDAAAVSERAPNAFAARRDVGLFLAEQLPTIRAMAAARGSTLPPTTLERPVFLYWGQGFAAAPPLVRMCLDRLREVDPGADVHVLDDAALPYYVDLPEDLLARVGENRTHLSDLLRLALLEQYGGIWLDATCLVTRPLHEHVPPLLEESDFFAFTYLGPHISSWFLAARRGSYVVRMWRAAMWRWWEVRGELSDYFLMHHAFEMLHELDEEFRAEFDRVPKVSARPPHELQRALLTPFDADAVTDLAGRSFVHKLKYKLTPGQVTVGTTVAHLVRGDHPKL